jgi:hypothetical protein
MIHIRRFPLVGLCALAVAGASWHAPAARAQTLREIDLSSPAALGTRIESVRGADGAPAIRVTAAWPVVINLAEVPDPNVEATRLVFEARARAEGLAGAAFLEIWCHFPDGKQYFGRGLDSTVTGSGDWTTIRTMFLLRAGQRPSKVTLNLVINGRGSVSIAQARLLKADR